MPVAFWRFTPPAPRQPNKKEEVANGLLAQGLPWRCLPSDLTLPVDPSPGLRSAESSRENAGSRLPAAPRRWLARGLLLQTAGEGSDFAHAGEAFS